MSALSPWPAALRVDELPAWIDIERRLCTRADLRVSSRTDEVPPEWFASCATRSYIGGRGPRDDSDARAAPCATPSDEACATLRDLHGRKGPRECSCVQRPCRAVRLEYFDGLGHVLKHQLGELVFELLDGSVHAFQHAFDREVWSTGALYVEALQGGFGGHSIYCHQWGAKLGCGDVDALGAREQQACFRRNYATAADHMRSHLTCFRVPPLSSWFGLTSLPPLDGAAPADHKRRQHQQQKQHDGDGAAASGADRRQCVHLRHAEAPLAAPPSVVVVGSSGGRRRRNGTGTGSAAGAASAAAVDDSERRGAADEGERRMRAWHHVLRHAQRCYWDKPPPAGLVRPVCDHLAAAADGTGPATATAARGGRAASAAAAGRAYSLAIHVRAGDALAANLSRAHESLAALPRGLDFADALAGALTERGGRLRVMVVTDLPAADIEARLRAASRALQLTAPLVPKTTHDGTAFLASQSRRGVPLAFLPDGHPIVAWHCMAASDVLLPTLSHFSASAAMLGRGLKVTWPVPKGVDRSYLFWLPIKAAQARLGQAYLEVDDDATSEEHEDDGGGGGGTISSRAAARRVAATLLAGRASE